MKKRFNLLSLGLAVSILGGSLSLGNVYANETNTNKEISTMEINADNSIDEKVQVEVLFDSTDGEFVKEVIFDDGTKLTDYDYDIKQLKQEKGFYPIGDYFDYSVWIIRDNGTKLSLSTDSKDKVRFNSNEKDLAWNVLSHPNHGFGSDSRWKNTKVMGWQFDCHYDLAKFKSYWNLEPDATADSYWEVVKNGCNP